MTSNVFWLLKKTCALRGFKVLCLNLSLATPLSFPNFFNSILFRKLQLSFFCERTFDQNAVLPRLLVSDTHRHFTWFKLWVGSLPTPRAPPPDFENFLNVWFRNLEVERLVSECRKEVEGLVSKPIKTCFGTRFLLHPQSFVLVAMMIEKRRQKMDLCRSSSGGRAMKASLVQGFDACVVVLLQINEQ